jgi:signal transduction histidine kinase
MQLRAELIEDPDIRGKLLSDLHEITAMINEAVGYLRDAVEQEAVEEVMILTFLESICDDYADIGKHVTFEKPDPLTVKSRGTIFAPQPAEYDIVCTRQTTLSCQPNRLRRAINNLIDNALKYGELARVRVIADASTITVRINDVGPGLTREQMTRVFEPFYRAEGSRNRSSGGMGLGLSLAKSVVTAHGGRISLFNHDRCGLEVRITLPRHIGATEIPTDPI